ASAGWVIWVRESSWRPGRQTQGQGLRQQTRGWRASDPCRVLYPSRSVPFIAGVLVAPACDGFALDVVGAEHALPHLVPEHAGLVIVRLSDRHGLFEGELACGQFGRRL